MPNQNVVAARGEEKRVFRFTQHVFPQLLRRHFDTSPCRMFSEDAKIDGGEFPHQAPGGARR